MTIRKLENNNVSSLLVKIVLIAGVTAGGIFAVNKIIHKKPAATEKVLSAKTKKGKNNDLTTIVVKSSQTISNSLQKTAENVLGEATKIVENAVSTTKDKAEDIIIKTAVDKVMEQIDKMPEPEREKIKEQICK